MTRLNGIRAVSPTELAKVYPAGCELQIAYKSRFGVGQLSCQAQTDAADGERVHREFELQASRFMAPKAATTRAYAPDNTANRPPLASTRANLVLIVLGALLLLVAFALGN